MKYAIAFILMVVFGFPADCRAEVPQSRAQISLSFAPIVRQATPAVVNIYTKKLVRQRVSPLMDDPFFRQFFGDITPHGMTRKRMENSLGSGVIVRPEGLVLTSKHVIADADEISVVLSDRREFDAKVVLSDDRTDLAVLRIEGKSEKFPSLELGDSDQAQVGDIVIAIGNPFGVGQTVTMGIISAVAHKSLGAGDMGYFLQTDAAINPGNSGGALVTMDGKVVGINAAIYSRDGGNMGIGFAIPANIAKLILDAAIEGRKNIVHPWTGISGQALTQNIAASLGMEQPSGVLVKSLHSASPASKAGMQVGDVIISVNGHDISEEGEFNYRIASLPIGSVADIGVLRKGRRVDVNMDVIAPPENTPRDETWIEGANPLSGAMISNLSPAVATDMGMPDNATGVVVAKVKEPSNASGLGIRPGDLIVAINGQKTDKVEEVSSLLAQKRAGWKISIRRGGSVMTIMIGR